ncbi:hypothetical protein B1812_12140 [Methylocystis bryophila]|uniref:Uncharacterized protein n=1 Tax=Methylocystis bryophila TaxID=655015 RepID=A0A1W6MVS6_9HYPH|nr:hypothetical protein B1812_12140 [Methylocystis bryophila]
MRKAPVEAPMTLSKRLAHFRRSRGRVKERAMRRFWRGLAKRERHWRKAWAKGSPQRLAPVVEMSRRVRIGAEGSIVHCPNLARRIA